MLPQGSKNKKMYRDTMMNLSAWFSTRVLRQGQTSSGKEYPLSMPQEAVYTQELSYPGSSRNNVTYGFRLKGYDLKSLQKAVELALKCHNMANIRFTRLGRDPAYIILPYEERSIIVNTFRDSRAPISLPESDIVKRSRNELSRRLGLCLTGGEYQYIQDHGMRSFDLKKEVLRASLIETQSACSIIFVITFHHVGADSFHASKMWSLIEKNYSGLTHGKRVALPRKRPRYLSHSYLTKLNLKYIRSPHFEEDKNFWMKKFSGGTPGTPDLSFLDHCKAEADDTAELPSETFVFKFSGTRISDFCCQVGTSEFRVFLASFAISVWKLTAGEEFVVGVSRHNRNSLKLAAVEGMLATVVPLLLKYNKQASFYQFLKETLRNDVNELKAHGNFPMFQLHRILREEGILLPGTSLFDIVFSFQPLDGFDEKKGHQIIFEAIAGIEIHVRDLGSDCFEVVLAYQTAKHSRVTIERLCGYWQHTLTSLLADPHTPLENYSIVSGYESHLVKSGFNLTKSPFPQTKCIHELIETQASMFPNTLAVRAHSSNKESLTYGELCDTSKSIAALILRETLVEIEDVVVGIFMERSLDMVVSILGTLFAGAAYLPLNPEYSIERLAYMVTDSGTNVIITQRKFFDRVKQASPPEKKVICVDDTDLSEYAHTATTSGKAGPSNLAYIIYTSGSTGNPKGVMVEHKALMNRIHWMQKQYQLRSDDVVLQKTPYSFDVSVWEFMWPLSCGATLALAKPGGERDVDYLVGAIRQHGVTTLHFVPSMLSVFLKSAGGRQCTSVHRMICSGEELPSNLARGYREVFPSSKLYNLYGPTEAAIDVSSFDCDQLERDPVPIGKPISNIQLFVVDEAMQLVPVGVTGEILIAGVGLARGYINNPELTEAKFISDTTFMPGERMYRTGDLGRWLPDGNLEFIGRFDSQVKIRGFRVELGEVEGSLRRQTDLLQDCAVVVTGQNENKRLVAYIVRSSAKPSLEDSFSKLRSRLEDILPNWMVPSHFVPIDQIPLSSNGKVDRSLLSRLAKDAPIVETSRVAEARNTLEEGIVGIWRELLHLDKLGIDSNFFEFGGHSLLAVEAVGKMKEKLGVSIDLRTFHKHPTVRKLSDRLNRCKEVNHPSPYQQTEKEMRSHAVKRSHDEIAHASTSMHRMVIRDYQIAGSKAYHFQEALSFVDKSFHPILFEQGLRQVVQKHKSLNSFFSSDLQWEITRDSLRFDYKCQESNFTSDAMLGQLHAFLNADKTNLFDATSESGTLCRFRSFYNASGQVYLAMSFHHAIFDGFSNALLIKEIFETYKMLRAGQSPAADSECVSAPSSQFPFIIERFEKVHAKQCRSYYANKFKGFDFPQKPLSNLSPSCQETFLVTAKESRIPKELFLAAFSLSFMGAFENDDACIGVVTNRRDCSCLEQVGFFWNLVPYHMQVGDLHDLLKQLKRQQEEINSKSIGLYSYPKILEEFNGITRMFDVTFKYVQFHDYFKKSLVDDFQLSPVFFRDEYAFGMNVTVVAHPSLYEVQIDYDKNLFPEARVLRTKESFMKLIP